MNYFMKVNPYIYSFNKDDLLNNPQFIAINILYEGYSFELKGFLTDEKDNESKIIDFEDIEDIIIKFNFSFKNKDGNILFKSYSILDIKGQLYQEKNEAPIPFYLEKADFSFVLKIINLFLFNEPFYGNFRKRLSNTIEDFDKINENGKNELLLFYGKSTFDEEENFLFGNEHCLKFNLTAKNKKVLYTFNFGKESFKKEFVKTVDKSYFSDKRLTEDSKLLKEVNPELTYLYSGDISLNETMNTFHKVTELCKVFG